MSVRRDQKRKDRIARRERKRQDMLRPGARSKYARKKAWLNSHTRTEMMPIAYREPKRDEFGDIVTVDGEPNGRPVMIEVTRMEEVRRQLWGFEVSSPKPWI